MILGPELLRTRPNEPNRTVGRVTETLELPTQLRLLRLTGLGIDLVLRVAQHPAP
jgi:hypothetical protein